MPFAGVSCSGGSPVLVGVLTSLGCGRVEGRYSRRAVTISCLCFQVLACLSSKYVVGALVTIMLFSILGFCVAGGCVIVITGPGALSGGRASAAFVHVARLSFVFGACCLIVPVCSMNAVPLSNTDLGALPFVLMSNRYDAWALCRTVR